MSVASKRFKSSGGAAAVVSSGVGPTVARHMIRRKRAVKMPTKGTTFGGRFARPASQRLDYLKTDLT